MPKKKEMTASDDGLWPISLMIKKNGWKTFWEDDDRMCNVVSLRRVKNIQMLKVSY